MLMVNDGSINCSKHTAGIIAGASRTNADTKYSVMNCI